MTFEIPPGGPYLLAHSVGLMPRTARARLNAAVLDPWAQKGDAWTDWLAVIDDFRCGIARIIGAQAKDICPQANVSTGLFALLSSLPRQAGKDVLLASAHSFPTIGFVMEQAERLGFRMELLPEDRSPGDASMWEAALRDDVAAVVAMHVHSNTGVVAPVADICAVARQRGIVSIIDVAQSTGIMPVEPIAWGADAVIGSCLKWLCGGPGAGWLWANPETTRDFRPLTVGWFSHENPFEFDIRDFRYAGDARKFWGGTPSVAPFALASAGVALIAENGRGAVFAHNRRLIACVAEAAPRWADQLDRTNRGGTICLNAGGETAAIEARLNAAGCRFDRRGDTLRLSFHLLNTDEDANIVAACLV